MATYLERYLNGDYQEVWDELILQREAVHQEPLKPDVDAVVFETMRRVRMNIEQVTARLAALGYQFGIYPDGQTQVPYYDQPYHPPAGRIAEEIRDFERFKGVGKIPLSIKMFWEIVGDVNWMGFFPYWPEYSDPLVVYPIEAAREDYEDWLFMVNEGEMDVGPFGIAFAPDFYHKENVSGAEPYEIILPNGSIDGVVEYEIHKTTFVNYLRICFDQGGFPGINHADGNVTKILDQLKEGLVPF